MPRIGAPETFIECKYIFRVHGALLACSAALNNKRLAVLSSKRSFMIFRPPELLPTRGAVFELIANPVKRFSERARLDAVINDRVTSSSTVPAGWCVHVGYVSFSALCNICFIELEETGMERVLYREVGVSLEAPNVTACGAPSRISFFSSSCLVLVVDLFQSIILKWQ